MNLELIIKAVDIVSLVLWGAILVRVVLMFSTQYHLSGKLQFIQLIYAIRLGQSIELIILIWELTQIYPLPLISCWNFSLKAILLYVFLESQTNVLWFALFGVVCAAWQCIFKLSRILHPNTMMSLIFYNSFFVPIPVEFFFSFFIVNDYYLRHYEQMSALSIILLRAFQILLSFQFIFNIVNLFGYRQMFYEGRRERQRSQLQIRNTDTDINTNTNTNTNANAIQQTQQANNE